MKSMMMAVVFVLVSMFAVDAYAETCHELYLDQGQGVSSVVRDLGFSVMAWKSQYVSVPDAKTGTEVSKDDPWAMAHLQITQKVIVDCGLYDEQESKPAPKANPVHIADGQVLTVEAALTTTVTATAPISVQPVVVATPVVASSQTQSGSIRQSAILWPGNPRVFYSRPLSSSSSSNNILLPFIILAFIPIIHNIRRRPPRSEPVPVVEAEPEVEIAPALLDFPTEAA